MPLVFPVMGADGLARGRRVRVRLGAMDPISLEIGGTVIAQLDAQNDEGAAAEADSEDDEDNTLAAPLALAIDLDDTPTPADAGAAS